MSTSAFDRLWCRATGNDLRFQALRSPAAEMGLNRSFNFGKLGILFLLERPDMAWVAKHSVQPKLELEAIFVANLTLSSAIASGAVQADINVHRVRRPSSRYLTMHYPVVQWPRANPVQR